MGRTTQGFERRTARASTALDIRATPDVVLAARRLRRDLRDDWFPDPLLYKDIFISPQRLEFIKRNCQNHEICIAEQFDVPKPGFTLRYGLETVFRDRLMYQCLADKLAPHYDSLLDSRVFSFRLGGHTGDYIFENAVDSWRNFIQTVRSELNSSGGVLLRTDVQNFFESVNIEILCQILTRYAPSDPSLKSLTKPLAQMLLHWSPYEGRGLPQNRDASSFLGNFFLHPVDQQMIVRLKCNYFRYMDDIMIIAPSEVAARRALRDLIVALRDLQLNVNAKKTSITSISESDRIDEHLPPPSLELEQINALLTPRKKVSDVGRVVPLLRNLLMRVLAADDPPEREFKFCLHRLQTLSKVQGVDLELGDITEKLIPHMYDRPWATESICTYLASVPVTGRHHRLLTTLLRSGAGTVYQWQIYRLWNLLGLMKFYDPVLMRYARRVIQEKADTPKLASAILYAGSLGSKDDKMEIVRRLRRTNSRFIRRASCIALQELPARDAPALVEEYLTGDERSEYQGLVTNDDHDYYAAPFRIMASEVMLDMPDVYAN